MSHNISNTSSLSFHGIAVILVPPHVQDYTPKLQDEPPQPHSPEKVSGFIQAVGTQQVEHQAVAGGELAL